MGLVLLVASALLLLGAVRTVSAARADARAAAGPVVPARVLSRQIVRVSGRGVTYHTDYTVAFQTKAGRPLRLLIRVDGQDPCTCDPAQVSYDPARPQTARLVGTPRKGAWSAAFETLLALPLGVFGALLLQVGWDLPKAKARGAARVEARRQKRAAKRR